MPSSTSRPFVTFAIAVFVSGCPNSSTPDSTPPSAGEDGPPADPMPPEQDSAAPTLVPSTSATPDVDKTGLRSFINEHIAGLRRCYDDARRTHPDLEGRVTYTLSIETTGAVSSVTLDEDTLRSTMFNMCARKAILEWTFPQMPEAGQVTFPVVFVSG